MDDDSAEAASDGSYGGDDGRRRGLSSSSSSSSASTPAHVTFVVRVMSKAIFMISTNRDYPPEFNSHNEQDLFLDPENNPEHVASDHILTYNISVCNVFDGTTSHRAYLGLYAADFGCVVYDVSVLHHDGECHGGGH